MFNESLYSITAQKIRDQIKTGELKPESKLSLRKLSTEFHVSKTTIERAIEMLKDEELVVSVPQSGTVVSTDAWLKLNGHDLPNWHKIGALGMHKPLSDALLRFRDMVTDTSAEYLYEFYHGFYEEEFGSFSYMKKAMAEVDPDAYFSNYRCADLNGSYETRETITEYVKKYGINTTPKNIILFDNWLQAKNTTLYAFMRYGFKCCAMQYDEVGAYENIPTLGGNLHSLPYDREGILPDALIKSIGRGDNSLLYINPVNHFPTGITMSHERRDQIMSICRKYRLPVFENDLLRDLWVTEPPPPMKSDDKNNQIVYIGSFATSFQANARFAWVIAPSVIVERIGEVKCQVYSINNRILDMFANSYIKGGYYEQSMAHIRAKLPARLSKVDEILKKHLGDIAEWDKECINYFVWLKFKAGIDAGKIFYDCSNMVTISGTKYRTDSHILLNSICESLERTEAAAANLAFLASKQTKI